MELIAAYVAALVLFLVLDLVWIKSVMRPIFEQDIGDYMLEEPRLVPAVAFFLLYLAGLFYLAVLPAVEAGTWLVAAVDGALIGAIAYGTYEMTNLATLRRWTPRMLAIDTGWGCFSSAVTSVAGYYIYALLT